MCIFSLILSSFLLMRVHVSDELNSVHLYEHVHHTFATNSYVMHLHTHNANDSGGSNEMGKIQLVSNQIEGCRKHLSLKIVNSEKEKCSGFESSAKRTQIHTFISSSLSCEAVPA